MGGKRLWKGWWRSRGRESGRSGLSRGGGRRGTLDRSCGRRRWLCGLLLGMRTLEGRGEIVDLHRGKDGPDYELVLVLDGLDIPGGIHTFRSLLFLFHVFISKVSISFMIRRLCFGGFLGLSNGRGKR